MAEAVATTTGTMATATGTDAAQRRLGIALFLGALLAFACYDAFAKAMVLHYPPTVMNLSRYIAITLMALGLLAVQADRTLWRPWRLPHQRLLLARSAMLAVVATCFMTALVTMPLAEATAIYFTAPLLMVALSPWLLGERVNRRQWAAVLAGFAGMLLIVRPGGNLPLLGTVLMAVSALCYALFQVLTRRLSGKVAAPVQFVYMAVVCLVATHLPALWAPAVALPPWPQMLGLIAGGFVSGTAQLMLLAAFRRVGLATLAPLNYVQLLLAVLISSFWFQRPPDALALAGIVLIMAAGLWLARQAPAPATR